MEAAGELAQVLEPGVELAGRVLDQLAAGGDVLLQLHLRDPEQERRRDEPLLRAVVQVALEPPPLLVAGPDDAGTRGLQVLAGLRARDRERDEVAEGGQPHLGVPGGSGSALPIATAPQSVPATTIGAAMVERYPVLQHQLGERAADGAPVVDARRRAGLADAADRRRLAVGEHPRAERKGLDPVAVVAADDRGRVVALVPPDEGRITSSTGRTPPTPRRRRAPGSPRRRRASRRAGAPAAPARGGPTSTSFDSGSSASVPPSADCSRSVRSIPLVTRYAGAAAVAGTGLFDHAISRWPPSFVCQWPTCGLPCPVLQMRRASLGTPPLLRRDQRLPELAPQDLVAREARRALAGVVEENDAAALVEHADERLRGLRKHAGELVAEARSRRSAAARSSVRR